MPDFIPPTQRPVWHDLTSLATSLPPLRELMQRPGREHLQAAAAGITLDYSHQAVDDNVLNHLMNLAESSQIIPQAHAMFRGEPINVTENRPVLHVALRGTHLPQAPWGQEISRSIQTELQRFTAFADRIRTDQLPGFAGAPITDIVNLGIGGSDLGPRLGIEALAPWALQHPTAVRVHCVSNLDAWSLYSTLATLDPSRTAFIVQSKSFTTPETMMLAASARRWLQDGGCPPDLQSRHLIAVTARPDLAQTAAFTSDHIFHLWDWVGGRYSLWSAIGLPLAITIGAEGFRSLLAGARAMDEHFLSAPPQQNLPLLLALLGVWNINFMGSPTHVIAPYAAAFSRLHSYVQQLDMESNGKRTQIDGRPVQCQTAPVVWGGLGIEGQHAYFQLLHQGQHRVPMDFIAVRTDSTPMPLAAQHHRLVLDSLRAQAQALAMGRSEDATRQLMQAEGADNATTQRLALHRTYPGNTPSNLLWLDELTPHHLGALIALYEHKVFTQAALWGINAFDQWGVELGKTLLQSLREPTR